ncbi:hypothetical protein F8O01_01955 [Pseudoclavibacter chungangensis]|uniref:Solute-binding protein family 5 domain-containing protein n=1 Tax=Pseudoclavibacter chungangensis TaxID=587635 RepID=A0A7J5C0U6_9MICO|nr:ABC transporter substrate-binding protein [Pseudoclavibacter chungangensis]KAB1662246.1 hypothetical protein F8O01_01955 [Pseudoclavibacter chungangensis]NYJ65451.1 peptide/nickel transport system substrate-binding protein [Pseudoclavibacter chungangensis]
MTHRRLPVALALVAGLGLAGCSGTAGADVPSEPVSGGTLTYLANTEPPVWDGQRIPSLNLNSINSSIFDTVTTQLPEASGYGPGLATAWTVSDDGLVYTFDLRDDVTFHDGSPFNAEVLKQNLDRPLSEPDLATVGNGIAENVVVDDDTLEVHLSKPNGAFIHALSTPHWPIYSGEILSNHSSQELSADPTLSIGTGPFKVESYTKGSSLTLVRNDDYNWAPETASHQGPAYLDQVVVNFVPETQARIGALNSQQAQAIDQVPPLNFAEVEAGGNAILEQDNTGTPYQLHLNPNVAPFDDLNVRRGFQAAIDVNAALQSVYQGAYELAWGPTLPGTAPAGSADESIKGTWGFDADKAAQYFAEAGYTEKDAEGYLVKDGQRLHLDWYVDSLYAQTDQRQQLGEAIVLLAKDAGIEIVRTPFDTATFTAKIAEGKHQLADSSRGYADVATSIQPFTTAAIPTSNGGSGINYGLVSDPEIDAQAAILRASNDDAERVAAAHVAQQRIIDQAYSLPLYVPKKTVGVTPAVQGWAFDQVGYTDTFHGVWLAQ